MPQQKLSMIKNGKKVRVHVGQRGGLFIMQGGNKKYLSQQEAGKFGFGAAAKMFGKVKGLASKAKGMKMPKMPKIPSMAGIQSGLNKLENMTTQATGMAAQATGMATQAQNLAGQVGLTGQTPTPIPQQQPVAPPTPGRFAQMTNRMNKGLKQMGNYAGNVASTVGNVAAMPYNAVAPTAALMARGATGLVGSMMGGAQQQKKLQQAQQN